MYFEVFERPPSVLECQEYFSGFQNTETNLVSLLLSVGYDDTNYVDHNLFTICGIYVDERDMTIFNRLKYWYMSCCGRCGVLRPNYFFIHHRTLTISTLCAVCRKDGDPMPCMTDVISLVDSAVLNAGAQSNDVLVDIMQVYKANSLLSIHKDCLIDFMVILAGEPHKEHSITVDDFICAVHDCGPYRFIKNGGRKNLQSVRFLCAQKQLVDNVSGSQRKRVRDSDKMFECGGYVSIFYQKKRSIMRIKHDVHHRREAPTQSLTNGVKEIISEMALNGMSPFQILAQIRKKSQNPVIYQDVYNAWASIMSSKFKRHEDPRKSVQMYLHECNTLEEIGVQSDPFGIVFSTKVGEKIVNSWRVEEVLIDSTYKTNKQQLELFVLIGSCMGAGFPLGYFLLEAGTGGGLKSREQSLTFFLECLSNKFSMLKPSFAFTDKEAAQINAIGNVFLLDAALCFWHMKRAIKRKLRELIKENKSTIKDEDEKKIFALIDAHYFRSPVTSKLSSAELRVVAISELDSFFRALQTETFFYSYLMNNWYDTITWKLWGRRHEHMIPFSRTTMKVESHWSMLKRQFLLPYNRPRVDLLVHVIASTVMVKFDHEYEALKLGRKKPFWWNAFVSMWKKASTSVINGAYHTDQANFICSCPAWLRSQYFICKHLVQDMACPHYHQITIRRSPPFVIIDNNSARLIANVDNEQLSLECSNDHNLRGNSTCIGGLQQEIAMVPHNGQEIQTEVEIKSEVKEIMDWFHNHVSELASCNAGMRQVQYLHDRILPRLRRYKSNVESAQRSRSVQQTWACDDTLYLP